jgi:uncharacterized protein YbaA (DUF1428 family)
MALYVDGFVLPLKKKNVAQYRRIAQQAARVWKKHGALEYREWVGEDLTPKWALPFPRLARARAGETVVLAWIVYRSRAHRDRVIARVMKDPLMTGMDPKAMPFDVRRMAYGGFELLVRD